MSTRRLVVVSMVLCRVSFSSVGGSFKVWKEMSGY